MGNFFALNRIIIVINPLLYMRSNRIRAIIALTAFFFISQYEVSSAQINKAVALVKGDAVTAAGAVATDVSITTYKGSERINTTKVTPEGKFQIVLQPNTQYRVTFSSSNYYFHEEQLSIPASDKYQEVHMHVTLTALEVGKPYTFSNLIFEPKSSDISQNVMAEMDNIANAMKHNSHLTVSATVYPDESPMGKKAAAQNGLAASRKSALMSYFSSKNIPSSNVTIEISNNVPASGSFERIVTTDAAPVKSKKKKKAPAPGVMGKKMMVPQYAVIVMNMGS